MIAAQVLRLTGPDGVGIVEAPPPSAGSDDVLVEVRAVGLGHPDVLLSYGEYQRKPDLPFTLGLEFAGIARSAAEGVETGDPVVGCGFVSAAAELAVVNRGRVLPMPSGFTFAEAACLPLNYLTAHFALTTRGQLQTGESVLVHGASGGLGTAVVQVARWMGAQVVPTSPSDEDGKEAGHDLDIVVDVVGGQTRLARSLRALRPGGRFLTLGFAGGEIAEVKLNRLLLTNTDVRGVAWGAYADRFPAYPREQWSALLPAFAMPEVRPAVARTFPLSQASQALRYLTERGRRGRVVLDVKAAHHRP